MMNGWMIDIAEETQGGNVLQRRQALLAKGAIIFYRKGGRLFVITGRQFFLVPPLGMRKKFWSPPSACAK